MAIIQSGASSTSLLTVDPTFLAARVSDHPPEILGSYQVSTSTTAAAYASAGTAFSFRWAPATATQLCMIRRVEVGMYVVGAITTSQFASVSMTRASTWTASDSAGTQILFSTPNSNKLRATMPATAFTTGGDMRMGVITAGTRLLDTNPLATIAGTTGTAAGTTAIPLTPIFQHQTGDYPLILGANEGFILVNNNAILSGTVSIVVNVEWMELAATTGNAIAY